jgi:hypothetical protein
MGQYMLAALRLWHAFIHAHQGSKALQGALLRRQRQCIKHQAAIAMMKRTAPCRINAAKTNNHG